MICPICGEPMHTYIQPAAVLGRADYLLAECREKSCDYRYVTLSPEQHRTMTPERRESYLKVNQRIRARQSSKTVGVQR